MKSKLFSFFTVLVAFFAFGSLAFAQNAPQADRGFGKGEGHKMRRFERLNLTEAQRQQIRTLFENFKNSTRAQHEELRQLHEQRRSGGQLTAEQQTRATQLHEQLRAAKERQHAEVLAILTPEQRAEAEKFRGEGRGRRGGEFGKRGGFGKGIDGGRGEGLRGLGNLNLSETQQQQFRQLHESHRTATESLRNEMRQILSQRRAGNALTTEQQARLRELTSQLRASHEKLQNDSSAILTPEQRQQIEQRREEMRKRFEERRQMRGNTQPTIN